MVNVADGYRNYLIPGVWLPATEGGLRQVKTSRPPRSAREREAEEAAKLVEVLNGERVEVWPSVVRGPAIWLGDFADIAAPSRSSMGGRSTSGRWSCRTDQEIGSHEVTIKVYPGMTAVITVEVKEAK